MSVLVVGLLVVLALVAGWQIGVHQGHAWAKNGVAMEAVNEAAERLVAYTRAIEAGCPRCGHRLFAAELVRQPGAVEKLLEEERARKAKRRKR